MMSWLSRTLARFSALFRTRRIDRELEEDLATHIELLTDDLVAGGMDRDTARREARLRFGSVDSATEIHRDIRSLRGVETAVMDLRYAVRLLRRQPLLTCVIVLTLGIGIGAPVATFGLLNRFVFDVPQSADPDAFFRLVRPAGGSSGIATAPEYQRLVDSSRSARELAAWSVIAMRGPIGSDDPAPVRGLFVTCNFFRVFGVNAPVAGRLFTDDDCASAAPVAVISERIWRERFGADAAIVGSSLRYGGAPVTVVGVAAAPAIQRESRDPDPDFAADVWAPYTAQPSLTGPSAFLTEVMHHDDFRWLEVAGLLAPGYSRETARKLSCERSRRASRQRPARMGPGPRRSRSPTARGGRRPRLSCSRCSRWRSPCPRS